MKNICLACNLLCKYALMATVMSNFAFSHSIWIEPENFQVQNHWEFSIDQSGAKCLAGAYDGKKRSECETIDSALIEIPEEGTFKLWIRCKDYEKKQQGTRKFKVKVNGVYSQTNFGTHGKDGLHWQYGGAFNIAKGTCTISLVDTSCFYPRVDRILLTTDSDYIPKGEGELENVNYLDKRQNEIDNSDGVIINTDFPGGNGILIKKQNNAVTFRSDLRDTAGDWFYWCIRVNGAAGKNIAFKYRGTMRMSARGPAVSRDNVNWKWLETNCVSNRKEFTYQFGEDENEVYFSAVIPYRESNLKLFLQKHAESSYIRQDVLTLSRKGRKVERLHVGRLDGTARHRILLTSGHHACEMMGMYTVEGVMAKMLEDSEAGTWLRNNVEMLAVPFVDKDGVEDGDQGKARRPYDHVAGYRENSLYRETSAIMNFVPGWARGRLELAADIHCPGISGAWHEIIMTPVRLRGAEEEWELVEEFLSVVEESQSGALKFRLSDSQEFTTWDGNPNAKRAVYAPDQFPAWARKVFPGVTALALEVPYANVRYDRNVPAGGEVNQETARRFGQDLGQAVYVWLKRKDK